MKMNTKSSAVILALGLIATGPAAANIISDANQSSKSYGALLYEAGDKTGFVAAAENRDLTRAFAENEMLKFQSDDLERDCLCRTFFSW